ncbi:hypothetical protein MYX76_12330 [Desulfobacterota bacterium AH_259_B03_O07]|nr:hypothetical protein [Desulfobacterota bacterium AH_259_B03_O07]
MLIGRTNLQRVKIINKFITKIWIFAFLSIGILPCPVHAKDYIWEQLWHDGSRYAKVITSKNQCPQIDIAGKLYGMQQHVGPGDNDHPNRICIRQLPDTARDVSIENVKLPSIPKQPTRIVIFGDTGYSIGVSDGVQACGNPNSWLYSGLVKLAAKLKPQVIVHVGDMTYAKTRCANPKLCEGYPHGRGWQVWKTYYFDAIQLLINKAAWINLRGNHKSCSEIGMDWFRYFDLGDYPDHCLKHTPSYHIPWKDHDWYIIDNSEGSVPPIPNEVEYYSSHLAKLYSQMERPNWIFVHFPYYSMIIPRQKIAQDLLATASSFKYAANKTPFNLLTEFLFAAHMHSFQFIQLQDENKPAQLLTGTGGVFMFPYQGVTDLAGQKIYAGTVKNGINIYAYGFIYLEKEHEGWQAAFYDHQGQKRVICKIKGRNVKCRQEML